MKIYAHWNGDQPFTKVVKIDDSKTVAGLRDACWEALRERHPELTAGGPGALKLTGADRRPLSLGSCLADVLTRGDDVYFGLDSSAAPPSGGQPDDAVSAGQRSPGAGAARSVGPGGSPGDTAALTAAAAPLAAAAAAASSGGQEPGRCAEVAAAAAHTSSGPASTDSRATASNAAAQQAAEGSKLVEDSAGRAGSTSAGAGAVTSEALAPVVRALWLRAEEAVAQLHYRGAGEILQQALLLVPEPSSPTHIATLMRLARLWLSAGNPGAAVRWALRAAKQRPTDPAVLELAGDCLREGGRPREAAAQYQSALEALEEGEEEQDKAGEALASQALAPADRDADPSSSSPPLLRLRLSLAACLAAIPGSITPPYDNQDLAASLVMSVLERDPGHWEALRLYARIAMDRGLREDALRVALRLVVGRPKHAGAKELLAECLKDEAGCRQLYEELGLPYSDAESAANGVVAAAANGGTSSSTAAAMAFVATAVKDFGKVDTCISLLRRAARLDPSNPSYRLNLVHALELRQELPEAVAAGASYCRTSGTQLAGRPLRDVDSLLRDLPELRDPLALSWYTSQPMWGSQPPPARQQVEDSAAAAATQLGEAAGPRKEGGDAAGGGGGGGAGGDAAVGPGARAPLVKVTYSSDQLDELALLFTLAKVLFVGGALTAAARLCEMVEPLRSASAAELHTTLIRNEAAYFGCVAQLLKDYPPPPAAAARLRPPPPPPGAAATAAAAGGTDAAAGPLDGAGSEAAASSSDSAAAPLYLVGDSHCLSAAWRYVTLRGEQRLLRPLLVTGCKVWHLRPASEFYPKKQFEATMRLLPDGAQVVLVLGEIDCREGLLLAVQKGKYESVAEGIDATVAIYLEVLRGMVSERRMEVFVHPVPPVLNETRVIVAPFTAALRATVGAARAADPTLARRLHFLDFFEELLVSRHQAGSRVAAGTAGAATGGAAAAGSAGTGAGGAVGGSTAAALEAAPSGGSSGGLEGGAGAVEGLVSAPPAAAAASRALRPDLAFDGTHLAPTYLPLLDAVMSTIA